MPELPEVESLKKAFIKKLPKEAKILSLWHSSLNLRFPYPENLNEKIKNHNLLSIGRRAKYLLFELEDFYLVSHLGMSGTWREGKRQKKHDHIEIQFAPSLFYTFNDPRRFGSLHLVEKKGWQTHKLFKHLGPEPLSKDFDGNYLFQKTRKKQIAIKNLLMDQKNVVGVGNIYVNEALFLSGIRPTKRAARITKKQADILVQNTKAVLEKAIQAGGSYIKDFQNLEGTTSFQQKLLVYDQKECQVCSEKIKKIIFLGRATYYCSNCQK